jgi:hypothetical protein
MCLGKALEGIVEDDEAQLGIIQTVLGDVEGSAWMVS